MSCRRIWCSPSGRARVAAALAGLDAPLPEVAAIETLAALPREPEAGEVAVIDYDAIAPELRRSWAEHLARPPKWRVVWLSEGEYRNDLVWLLESGVLSNVVAGATVENVGDLRGTLYRLITRQYFGSGCYLGRVERRCTVRVSGSWDKPRLLHEAEEFGRDLQLHPRLTEHLKAVAEELFTNAIYNAPVDVNGKSRYRHFDRAQQVKLARGEGVLLELLGSATRVAVVAEDPFGSLTEERLRAYLARCLRRDQEQIEPKPGGAGLGLFQVFESVRHLMVSIDPGRRTELIGVIDRESSFREFSRAPKSLNVFVQDPRQASGRLGARPE